jgi:rRNA maturation endonuclease Nob1
MRYCAKCNQNFKDKEKKCPSCGSKLAKLGY